MKQKITALVIILALSLTTFAGCTLVGDDEISQLQTDNDALEERIEELESQVIDLQNEITKLQDGISEYTLSDDSYYESANTVLTTDEAPEGTVWTTPSGSKYHEAGCRYIDGRTDLTYFNSAADAESYGYSPCSVCH